MPEGLGGEFYEPEEENPMLGFRGASRYVAQSFRDCFEMEYRAMKKVRKEMGQTNVQLMVPFVRAVDEGKAVVDLLAEHGLVRGENELKLIMMCEIPSNADCAVGMIGGVMHAWILRSTEKTAKK